jgi:holo-[acyl-carrier protein] synthase
LSWQDAEVRSGERGRPELHVTGTVAAAAARAGVRGWHLSLTHDGGVAVAMVVAES